MEECIKLIYKNLSANKILYQNIKIKLFKIIAKLIIKLKLFCWKGIYYIVIGFKLKNSIILILINLCKIILKLID